MEDRRESRLCVGEKYLYRSAVVQWLKNGLGVIFSSEQVDDLEKSRRQQEHVHRSHVCRYTGDYKQFAPAKEQGIKKIN